MNNQSATQPRSINETEAAQFLGVEPNIVTYCVCTNRYRPPHERVRCPGKCSQADLEAFVDANAINGGTC